ncbi:MAG: P1 family peptidase [Proteobacteria bacterium]|nr:P1 family peptidase [Pseudomonadota bacterium]
MQAGPRNLITDVEGILVGNAHDHDAASGVTVVLPRTRSSAGVDVRGGAPGTRDIEALDPTCLVDAVDAVVLSGGSAFGLDAAGGVMAWLAARGRGFAIRDVVVPIVPAAILFDLLNGGDKAWGEEPPYRVLGKQALAAVTDVVELGAFGAGHGARAGLHAGGTGTASLELSGDGGRVAALVCVNSFGSVTLPGADDVYWAWPYEIDGEFGGCRPSAGWRADAEDWGAAKIQPGPRENTTIAVVATDIALTPAQAKRLAIMAQDGLARAIRPVHTPFDGDVVFALSTAARPLGEGGEVALARLGSAAADCLARAIARGVHAARQAAG